MTGSPSPQRVRYLNLTRWWRHNTKRWWVVAYSLIGVLNLLAYVDRVPFGRSRQPLEPFNLFIALVMFLFVAVNVRLGRREWEQRERARRLREEIEALRSRHQ